jgi:hypothetical protein
MCHVPRKRADGKEQINSWVDSDLANDIRELQKRLDLPYISDAIKLLLETGIKKYAHKHSSVSKSRPKTKTTDNKNR